MSLEASAAAVPWAGRGDRSSSSPRSAGHPAAGERERRQAAVPTHCGRSDRSGRHALDLTSARESAWCAHRCARRPVPRPDGADAPWPPRRCRPRTRGLRSADVQRRLTRRKPGPDAPAASTTASVEGSPPTDPGSERAGTVADAASPTCVIVRRRRRSVSRTVRSRVSVSRAFPTARCKPTIIVARTSDCRRTPPTAATWQRRVGIVDRARRTDRCSPAISADAAERALPGPGHRCNAGSPTTPRSRSTLATGQVVLEPDERSTGGYRGPELDGQGRR